MQKFFKKKTVIAVIVILSVTLICSAISMVHKGDKASAGSNAVGVVVTPMESLVSAGKNTIGGFFSALFHCLEYRNENEALSLQIDKLEQDIADMSGLEAENQRLSELLSLQDAQTENKTVAAKVVSYDHSNYYSQCTINRGSSSGIHKNDAVITVGGFVGYVSDVGTNWAKVITLFDEDCSVAAVVNRTGDQGIVEGNYALAQNGQIQMDYLPDNAAITQGDYVESSGMGGVFPSGIMLGKVLEVSKDTQTLSLTALLDPAVDFRRLREVLVIVE